jgi:hypothetical protein
MRRESIWIRGTGGRASTNGSGSEEMRSGLDPTLTSGDEATTDRHDGMQIRSGSPIQTRKKFGDLGSPAL